MRWTIQRKLYTGFSLAAVLLAGNAGIAKWAQMRAQATQQQITKTLGMLNDLEYLISYMRGVTVAQRNYLISGDENAIAGIPAMRQDADAVGARVHSAIAGDAEQSAHFSQYLDYLHQRRTFTNQLNATRKDQGFEAAKTLFESGVDARLFDSIIAEFNAMKVLAKSQLSAEEAADTLLQQRIAWAEGLSILLALALLTAIAVTLTRSIQHNVQIAVEMVTAMAEKNLSNADGQPVSADELAIAIEAINRMKQSMTVALTEVSRSSAQVAAAGAQIESSSREIADTTHTEKSDLEHFASSLAEMNATVREVAQHAGQASLAADEAVSRANDGRLTVQKTHEAMNRIHESVSAAATNITALGVETENIGEVVRIIQGIAGQTNLLALNAAIEAARAGEQGKGFAVVAQEVRQLAERTTNFTNEIAGKIESVQQGASRAVASMNQGESVVNEGVQQFNKVSDSLEVILQRIEAAQRGIAMIATATTQQSAATEGLTESISSISSELTRASEQVDQTALACAELSRLASGLQYVVDGFQLPHDRQGRLRADSGAVFSHAT